MKTSSDKSEHSNILTCRQTHPSHHTYYAVLQISLVLFLLSAYLPNISLVGQYFSSIVSATFSLQKDIYISETEDSEQCKLQPDYLYK